jgi:hypothetical protein
MRLPAIFRDKYLDVLLFCVIDPPIPLNPFCPMTTPSENPYSLAEEQFASLVKHLQSDESQGMEHGEVEELIRVEGNELLRRLFQGHLDERYACESSQVNVVGSDGVKRPHRRNRCQRQLATVFGEVVVSRLGYSSKEAGVSALYPGDGQLNLGPDQYSDGLRQRVATTAASVSFGETSQILSATTGSPVGKRQCEELIVKVSEDFDNFYAQRTVESVEASTDLLVITTDGKGIVMHSEDLRAATAAAVLKAAKAPKTRLSPGQKGQRKRMATVAAVYSMPRFERRPEQIIGPEVESLERPAISNKRVWASVEQDARTVIGSAFEEALRRDPKREREWVVLVDGETRQLVYMKAAAKQAKVEVTMILDFIHVLEYLWKAAFCFMAPGTVEVESWVMERALRILQGKASDVAAGIRRSATLQELSEKERENVDRCADYLLKYREFLRYDRYLEKGYPIATGVIEGACRHLICDRMDITGARWRLDRAEAVLKIRALKSSGDFAEFWKFHKVQEFKRNHVSKFQDPKRLLAA